MGGQGALPSPPSPSAHTLTPLASPQSLRLTPAPPAPRRLKRRCWSGQASSPRTPPRGGKPPPLPPGSHASADRSVSAPVGRQVGVPGQQKLTRAPAWTQTALGSVRFGRAARRSGSLLDASVYSGLLGRVAAGPEGQRGGEDTEGPAGDLGPEGVQVARAEAGSAVAEPAAWMEAGGCPGGPSSPVSPRWWRCPCETPCLQGREGVEPAWPSACCPQAPSLGCRPGPSIQGPHNWAEAGSWERERVVLSALLPHLQACRTLLGRWRHGGGRAYRWLTEYLPERMVNQMKELSSIAYAWGWGGALVPAALGAHCPPTSPGGRESGRPRHRQACSSLLPEQGEPAGPQDPGGGGPRGTRAAGGGESYREGEAQADQGGDDVPVHPQEALDPLQAVLGRGQRVGPDCSSRPGHGTFARGVGPQRPLGPRLGVPPVPGPAPSSGQALKTGRDKQDGTCLCGDEGLRRSNGACLWVNPKQWCWALCLPPGQAETQLLWVPGSLLRVGHSLAEERALAKREGCSCSILNLPGLPRAWCPQRHAVSREEGGDRPCSEPLRLRGRTWHSGRGQAGAGCAVGQAGLGSEARAGGEEAGLVSVCPSARESL